MWDDNDNSVGILWLWQDVWLQVLEQYGGLFGAILLQNINKNKTPVQIFPLYLDFMEITIYTLDQLREI